MRNSPVTGMSLSLPHNLHHVLCAHRWSPERLRMVQSTALKNLVEHACREVPYYQQLFREHGLKPGHIRTVEDLSRIPSTSKADLLKCDPDALLSRSADRKRLHYDCSSGSSGKPLGVYFDRQYIQNRNLRFLRGLWAAGYRPGKRLMLMTDRGDSKGRPWMNWKQVSVELEAQEMLVALHKFRPQVLYGFGTPLRNLIEFSKASGEVWPADCRVVWTAETLDPCTRRHLESITGSPICDFYGMTEMGLVAWQCKAQQGYHLANESIVSELVPLSQRSEDRQLILTNLTLYAMPLIRYETGDLAELMEAGTCACDSRLPRLRQVQGRVIDTLKFPDGHRISPYTLINRLELVAGLNAFQVIQRREDHVDLTVQVPYDRRSAVDPQIRDILAEVIQPYASFDIHYAQRLDMSRPGKFRCVRSDLLTDSHCDPDSLP